MVYLGWKYKSCLILEAGCADPITKNQFYHIEHLMLVVFDGDGDGKCCICIKTSNCWNGFSGNSLQRELSALIAFSLPPLVPLLSRILPSDACKIHKQGINIRWVLLLYPDISVPGKSWIPVGLTESLRNLGISMTWNFRLSDSLFWAE